MEQFDETFNGSERKVLVRRPPCVTFLQNGRIMLNKKAKDILARDAHFIIGRRNGCWYVQPAAEGYPVVSSSWSAILCRRILGKEEKKVLLLGKPENECYPLLEKDEPEKKPEPPKELKPIKLKEEKRKARRTPKKEVRDNDNGMLKKKKDGEVTYTDKVNRKEAADKMLREAKERDSEKIPVRIDAKTTIFIRKGENKEEAIKRYWDKRSKAERNEE